MAKKTLVEQFNELRAQLKKTEQTTMREAVNIITDMQPLNDQFAALQAELIPGEYAHQQLGHILTVLTNVRVGFENQLQPVDPIVQPALIPPTE